jgi:hypothetical protein
MPPLPLRERDAGLDALTCAETGEGYLDEKTHSAGDGVSVAADFVSFIETR